MDKLIRMVYPKLDEATATAIYHIALGRKIEWEGDDVNLQGQGNSRILAMMLAESTGRPFLAEAEVRTKLFETGMFDLVKNEIGPEGWLVRSKKPEDDPIIANPDKPWDTQPPLGFLLLGPDGQYYRNPARTEEEIMRWQQQRQSYQHAMQAQFDLHRAKGGLTPDYFFNSKRPHQNDLQQVSQRLIQAGALIEDYINVTNATRGSHPFTS